MCMCDCMRMCACVRACVRASVRAMIIRLNIVAHECLYILLQLTFYVH